MKRRNDGRPDVECDIIVHHQQVINHQDRKVSEYWAVYLGRAHDSEHRSETEAFARARRLAAGLKRPAWLFVEGRYDPLPDR